MASNLPRTEPNKTLSIMIYHIVDDDNRKNYSKVEILAWKAIMFKKMKG